MRRLYLRGGQPFAFVFRLVSRRDASREHLVDDDDYPETGGYYLLVRDRGEAADLPPSTVAISRAQIEMVVAECTDAEFDAYRALRATDEARLPAGLRVTDRLTGIHSLKQIARRAWILTNPHIRRPSS